MVRFLSAFLIAFGMLFGTATKAQEPVYVIAHMTNTQKAVDWALKQGSNALEIDLEFDSSGVPGDFKHGGICDCTCIGPIARLKSVCTRLRQGIKRPCNGKTDSATLLSHIAQKYKDNPSFHIVIIDSKVGDVASDKLDEAGIAVVDLMEEHLFGNGYRGEVVIGAPEPSHGGYVTTAWAYSISKAKRDHYSFTIDGARKINTAAAAQQALVAIPATHRVFGTGISRCATKAFNPFVDILQSVPGGYGFSYVWTVDLPKKMGTFIDAGARGIMTNFPQRAVKLVRKRSDVYLATSAPSN